MDFYSFEYAIFLSVAAILLFRVAPRFNWAVILAASIYFYASLEPAHLVFLGAMTLSTYLSGRKMAEAASQRVRKKWCAYNCVFVLGLLFLCKYLAFFFAALEDTAHLLGFTLQVPQAGMPLPVGISFYAFLAVSYSVDLYRRNIEAELHLGRFACHVAFFPKILAGPIERAKNLLPQLHDVQRFDWARTTNGLKLIVWGIFKKVVVADRLARFVDTVYQHPEDHSGLTIAIAIVFYSFQIYYDFSGYTDIAIGSSQVLGFRLMDNFDRPYSALSVGEFWRRWHISLSTWLRDYLYVPLGGNRVGRLRRSLNVLIVFFVCGLWHGANWTFVVWGLLHGIYIAGGALTAPIRQRIASAVGVASLPGLRRAIRVGLTFTLVALAWVFFRATSVTQALSVLGGLFSGWTGLAAPGGLEKAVFFGLPKLELFVALGALLFSWLFHRLESHDRMRAMLAARPLALRWTVYYVLILAVLVLAAPGSESFIYFQF